MSWFNINTGAIGILFLLLGWSYLSRDPVSVEVNPLNLPWVPIDVRKTKVYVSQTRDASMFTEKSRRTANLRGFATSNYKDSMNGYLDASLTAICVCPYGKCQVHDAIYDGSATGDICILDGNDGTAVIDAGNANTVVCAV